MFKHTTPKYIFPRRIKWVLLMPDGWMIPLTNMPKGIPGGFITKQGKRYVRQQTRSFNRIKLISNSRKALRRERFKLVELGVLEPGEVLPPHLTKQAE